MFALVWLFTAQILVAHGANKAGSVRLYDISKFNTCPYKNELKSSIKVDILKDGNDKYISGSIGLPIDFDNTFKININVDRWTGSEWKIDYYKQNGLACEIIQKILPDIFTTITSKFDPPILPTKCNIMKNTYKFKHVMANAGEVRIPSLMYSKYRVYARITTKDDKEIICVVSELDAKE